MKTPSGFEDQKFPLRHRLIYSCGLGLDSDLLNTVLMPIVHSSKDMGTTSPEDIKVNPKNVNYVSDAGALVRQNSIIDRLRISLKFNLTHYCNDRALTSGTAGPNFDDGTYTGDSITALSFLWRPIFNVYPEKLDAADDDTGTTVAAILALTKDATNEDVVPLTTNKLAQVGPSEKNQPMSTVNDVQVFGDYNLTTNTTMEDHVFDEDLLQDALRRYTNKGALRSCFGRTRHVTLTRARPYANFYIDKPVPRAIRRVQKYGFFAIQVHMPWEAEIGQKFISLDVSPSVSHLGIKMIANYHEWNNLHDQTPLDEI